MKDAGFAGLIHLMYARLPKAHNIPDWFQAEIGLSRSQHNEMQQVRLKQRDARANMAREEIVNLLSAGQRARLLKFEQDLRLAYQQFVWGSLPHPVQQEALFN